MDPPVTREALTHALSLHTIDPAVIKRFTTFGYKGYDTKIKAFLNNVYTTHFPDLPTKAHEALIRGGYPALELYFIKTR